MNPNPFGAFAEGIAGGVEKGVSNYVKMAMMKVDQQQRKDEIGAQYDYKLFSDTNLPLEIRKRAYESFQKRNKDWNTGISAPDLPNDMWDKPDFNKVLKKGLAIISSKEYSLQEKREFLGALHAEASITLGKGAGEALQPMIRGVESQAFAKGTGMLAKGGMTPETRGLLAMTPKGQDIMAERAKPIKPPKPVAPTTPMYKKQHIGGGMVQEYKWNAKTQAHDIPHGKPVKKEEAVDKYIKLGGDIIMVKGDKATTIKKGSLRARATHNAMKELGWIMADESQQLELIMKHERLLGEQTEQSQKIKPGTKLTMEMATTLLRAAKGDKELARKMAKEQGYTF